MKYIIPGQPIPLSRPRFSKDHVYDSQKGEKFAASINIKFWHKDKPFFLGPLHLTITFFMQSTRKKGWHDLRPDLDNLIKFVLDVMNGIVYNDDKQVVKITAEKIYDKEPRTEITIEEL